MAPLANLLIDMLKDSSIVSTVLSASSLSIKVCVYFTPHVLIFEVKLLIACYYRSMV